MTRNEVLEEIYTAVRRANQLRPAESQLACDEATVLFGGGGGLNSLDLVSLILDVEEAVNAKTGSTLVLADERSMSQRTSPFRSVESMANDILQRLGEAGL